MPEMNKMSEIAAMEHEVRQRTQIQMPRYKCHKEVNALKIAKLDSLGMAAGEELSEVRIIFTESAYAPIVVGGEWMNKHQPHVGGYYVVYADGYKSFSPAAAFEEGYTRI